MVRVYFFFFVGMCLVELQLPWIWFPAASPAKTPPRYVSLSYTVVEPASQRSGGGCAPRVMIQPLTPLGSVQLLPASQPYTSITTDQHVKMSVPQRPLYPTSRLHIPTYISFKPGSKVTGIIMRYYLLLLIDLTDKIPRYISVKF